MANYSKGKFRALAQNFDSARGKLLRRIKGARAAHAAIRASGRVPGEEARRARWAGKHGSAAQAAVIERVCQTLDD